MFEITGISVCPVGTTQMTMTVNNTRMTKVFKIAFMHYH